MPNQVDFIRKLEPEQTCRGKIFDDLTKKWYLALVLFDFGLQNCELGDLDSHNVQAKVIEMDEIDFQILAHLQSNCRQSISELAEKVHLSTSACHRRIKALEDAEVVTGYVAKLSPQKLGYRAEFFVELSLATQGEEAFEKFEKALKLIPEVLECYLVGGQYDYLLRIVAQDTEHYERIHRQGLCRLPGVSRIQSILSLRTVKPNHGLPIS